MHPHERDLPLPRAATPAECLKGASEALEHERAAVLATVLSRRGSAPATPGQKLLLCADGTCLGTVGGGALERSVLEAMVETLEAISPGRTQPSARPSRAGEESRHAPRRVELSLGASLGMCCGGGVEVLLEPFVPPRAVLLVGAGHVAVALVAALAPLGFSVTVCDEREEYAAPERLAGARRVVCGTAREGAIEAKLPREAAVLVMTHDHQLDQAVIEWALSEGYALVGGVGSRAKAARTRTRLEARGFSQSDRDRVRMPFGAPIGARSPEEIAVSIAAELIAWRRLGSLAPEEGPSDEGDAGAPTEGAAPVVSTAR